MRKKQSQYDVFTPPNKLHNRKRGLRYVPLFVMTLAFSFLPAGFSRANDKSDAFRDGLLVKYVTDDAVYLSGGRAVGLEVGQSFNIKRNPDKASENPAGISGEKELSSASTIIATIKVVSVANASAVCEIF